jgi:octaprenyl-diphosphate synthase
MSDSHTATLDADTAIPVMLRQILQPVQADLKDFDDEMRRWMSAKVRLLNVVCRYLRWQKGKQVRPALILLSAGAVGNVNQAVHQAAASIELLHTATLVHDDVVDSADTRRGFPSINWVWKNKVAVLVGDFLLAQSLRATLDIRRLDVLDMLSETTRRMSEGEMLQVQKRRNLHITEADYLQIIGGKTAALFSAGCYLGALLGEGSPEACQALRQYGEYLGLAFQITDDLFDYTGSASVIGKPMGVDTKNNPISLPLIHAFQEAPAAERRAMTKLLKKGGRKRDQSAIHDFCSQFHGIDYAAQKAQEYVRMAEGCLDQLEMSHCNRSLRGFLQLVINRQK